MIAFFETPKHHLKAKFILSHKKCQRCEFLNFKPERDPQKAMKFKILDKYNRVFQEFSLWLYG